MTNSKITIYKKRIYFADTDVTGFVYHAKWLEWMEAVRMEMLEKKGISIDELHQRGILIVVREIICKYLSPIKLGQFVETKAWIKNIGGPSLLIKYEIWNQSENKKAGEASSLIVFIDAEKGKPIKIPSDVKNLIAEEVLLVI